MPVTPGCCAGGGGHSPGGSSESGGEDGMVGGVCEERVGEVGECVHVEGEVGG